MGVLASVAGDVEDAGVVAPAVAQWFTVNGVPSALAAFCFLMFNLLDSPCLAAIATMAQQLQSRKWFWFAIAFQNVFAYIVTMIVFQIGRLAIYGIFSAATVVAFVFLAAIVFLLFRPDPYKDIKSYSRRSVEAASA